MKSDTFGVSQNPEAAGMMNIRDEEEKMLNAAFNPAHPKFFEELIPRAVRYNSLDEYMADLKEGTQEHGLVPGDRGYETASHEVRITMMKTVFQVATP
jgi:hypothetical protein